MIEEIFSSPYWGLSTSYFNRVAPLVEYYLRKGKSFENFPMPAEFIQKQEEKQAAKGDDEEDSKPYQIIDRVAIIPIKGTLTKSGGWCTYGTQDMINMINIANQDAKVRGIVTDTNSPGGSVSGIQALNRAITFSKKPVVGFANDSAHSAAYWGNAGVKYMYVATESSSFLGSIGVYMVHTDWSKWNQERGVNYTYITSEKATHKVLGNPDEKLSKMAKDHFTKECNRIHEAFIKDVEAGRGKRLNTAMDNFTGASWDGLEAIERGLADGIAYNGIEDCIEKANELAGSNRNIFSVYI